MPKQLRLTENFLLSTAALVTLTALSMLSLVKLHQFSLAALLPGLLVVAALAAVHIGLVVSGFA
ncbi:MAG: hypothetical protein M1298_05295, partial [Chloroflexi bacterium]|nr:hypothetical protein [Chloroflexota bacterium]